MIKSTALTNITQICAINRNVADVAYYQVKVK